MKFQKRLRLKDFSYIGFYKYFVTIVCNGKMPVFTEENIVKESLKLIKNISLNYGFSIWAYCFMPEHLHLLIEGKKEDSNLKKFVPMLKQKTSYMYKKTTGGKLWQENYYEHVLRNDEDVKSVARYILENPVRKKLANDFTNYPFSGSLVFDIKEF
ncbi:MAG: transposase [Candidatus Omnitrophica bacterium]|nr:transposase [Candidatus Omnitrophota bacterium]